MAGVDDVINRLSSPFEDSFMHMFADTANYSFYRLFFRGVSKSTISNAIFLTNSLLLVKFYVGGTTCLFNCPTIVHHIGSMLNKPLRVASTLLTQFDWIAGFTCVDKVLPNIIGK